MKLYEIASEIAAVFQKVEGADGELSPALEQELDDLSLAFEAKVENVLKYRAGLVTSAKAIEQEIFRLMALGAKLTRSADRLKQYVLGTMQRLGIRKIEGGLFPVRIQKNSRPSIRLTDGCGIPLNYQRTKIEFDGNAAFEDWKAGRPLPPEIEVIQGEHLRGA